jgi:CRISPR-associated protein Csm3
LYGRVFLRGAIEAVTGLHIGSAAGPLAIGGVDNPIVRDPLSGRPYVPGSSLKGKMRSLTERAAGSEQNWRIGRDVHIHVCQTPDSYARCSVCPVFGSMGQMAFSRPTCLLVRDVMLEPRSAERLDRARTDLPFSEVKWEVAIDRVTSAASPRQMERVPAGAVFAPFEMVYSIYGTADRERFRVVTRALQLLEDDYLGGTGSRGSGKVVFRDLELFAKSRADYELPESARDKQTYSTLDGLLGGLDDVLIWLGQRIPVTSA